MSVDTLKILLVEDNPGDVRLFQEALAESRISNFDLKHCQSFAEALLCLVDERPDVAVLDLGLPDAFGIAVVQKARASAAGVPLVVLTSVNDEALALQALQEGAQDYLIKGQLDPNLLARSLRYAMERHRLQIALRNESMIDELTSLYNRRGFLSLASQQVMGGRTRNSFSLVFIDLDGLKHINDTLGHLRGDEVLIETARLLRRCLRQFDILARWGGDEFVALLATSPDDSEEAIQRRFQTTLDSHNALSGLSPISFSVGVVAISRDEPGSLVDLIAQADTLMYMQKQEKRATRTLH